MDVLHGVLIILLIYALGVIAYLLYGRDQGTALLRLKNKNARDVVLSCLKKVGVTSSFERELQFGLTRQDIIKVNQTGLSNGFSLIESEHHEITPHDTFAFPCSEPMKIAESIVTILRADGYTAKIVSVYTQSRYGDNFVAIETDALPGAMLVFRRHKIIMTFPLIGEIIDLFSVDKK